MLQLGSFLMAILETKKNMRMDSRLLQKKSATYDKRGTKHQNKRRESHEKKGSAREEAPFRASCAFHCFLPWLCQKPKLEDRRYRATSKFPRHSQFQSWRAQSHHRDIRIVVARVLRADFVMLGPCGRIRLGGKHLLRVWKGIPRRGLLRMCSRS